jgi:hypothetical protein
MLEAAANPDAESPENVIKTLPPERRGNVEATISALTRQRRGITNRGRVTLQQMSEDEWDRLVNEANGS